MSEVRGGGTRPGLQRPERLKLAQRGRVEISANYCTPPDAEGEVPTEFVSETVTPPRALVSPLYVKGTTNWKFPPFFNPLVLANQVGATLLNEIVNDVVPLSCPPPAA